MNSEFYTGWLDHWGDQHAVVDAQKVSRVLGEMLTMGANVNMYVSTNPQTFLSVETHSNNKTVLVYQCKSLIQQPQQLVYFPSLWAYLQ